MRPVVRVTVCDTPMGVSQTADEFQHRRGGGAGRLRRPTGAWRHWLGMPTAALRRGGRRRQAAALLSVFPVPARPPDSGVCCRSIFIYHEEISLGKATVPVLTTAVVRSSTASYM
jgi:hypothetical protein